MENGIIDIIIILLLVGGKVFLDSFNKNRTNTLINKTQQWKDKAFNLKEIETVLYNEKLTVSKKKRIFNNEDYYEHLRHSHVKVTYETGKKHVNHHKILNALKRLQDCENRYKESILKKENREIKKTLMQEYKKAILMVYTEIIELINKMMVYLADKC